MAIPAIVVEFLAKGVPDVQRAFKSIQQAVEQSERAQGRATETGARSRIRAAQGEQKQKEQAFQQLAREASRWQSQMVKDAERSAKAEAKAVDSAAKDKIRAWRVADREHQKALDSGVRAAEKAAQAEARAFEKGEQEKNKAAARWVRDREAGQRKADRAADRQGSEFGRTVVGAGAKSFHTLMGGAQRVAGTLLQLGGGFSVADSIKEQGDLEKSAVQFSNAAYMGTGKRIDSNMLRSRARAEAASLGMDANDLMKGAHGFLAKTGNADEALASMKLFGEISKGTGASVEDVAGAAGTLRVQNADLKPDQMKEILLQTVRQGQKGSVEFSDLARSLGNITRTAGGYVGDQGKNQAELLGIAQLGMATMSDPSAVGTSLAGIEADTKKHWKGINKSLGGDQFDASGRIKSSPSEFIASVMEKTGGDTRKLQGLGYGKVAMKYFQALTPAFNEAGGGKAGKEALLETLKGSVAAPMPYQELQQNVANILNTSVEKFDAGVRQLKTAVGEELLPEFVSLIPVLKDFVPIAKDLATTFVSLVESLRKNPFEGIGLLMAGLMTKEIVSANIGSTIKSLISNAMSSGGAGGGAGGGLPGGAAGGLGLGAGALVVAGGAAESAGVLHYADKAYNAYAAGGAAGTQAYDDAKSGDPAKRAAAAKAIDDARAKSESSSAAMGYVDLAGKAVGSALNPLGAAAAYGTDKGANALGFKSGTDNAQAAIQAQRTVKQFDELNVAAQKAATALTAIGNQGGSGGSTDPANRSQPITSATRSK